MFEVQQFVLNGGGKILVPVGCRIDALVALLKVAFFVDAYEARVEI